MFDRLYMMTPLSLGDAFAVNGLIHHFGDMTDELYVPTGSEFYKTISSLYKEYVNIHVVAIDDVESENRFIFNNRLSRIKKPPIYTYNLNGTAIPIWWEMQYYDYFNLPYSLRYDNFRLPESVDGSQKLYEALSDNQPYILVHRYSYRYPNGFNINIPALRASMNLPECKIIEIQDGMTDDLMQYVDLIKNAEEIHCVASSVFNLVDSMHRHTKAKLFFHDIRKNSLMRVNSKWNNNRWNWIYYPEEVRH